MGLGEALMQILVKVSDVVALARRFRETPATAMTEVVAQMRSAFADTLERVMEAEIDLHLGEEADPSNKRNGYRSRTFTVKGIGAVTLRVPRDRKGTYDSRIVPASRRYDAEIERDMAILHLAGISTRMLAILSGRALGMRVSSTEVSNALKTLIPAARRFLERRLDGRRWKYLYVDGTNFRVRRTTVALEPTLVVLGVDEDGFKSVLAMMSGDKDARSAWEVVFADLKARGLDGTAVQLGIMDGLPGLADAFREAFPQARTARCWVHKAVNVLVRVPKRYQAAWKKDWDAVQYATDGSAARAAFVALKERWAAICGDAVACMERDLDELLVHYEFPKAHWDALRTTNPIERVNKEFKRRFKAMEQAGPDGIKTLLAFTALRLEFGWSQTSIAAAHLEHLVYRKKREARLEEITKGLLN